MRVSLTSIGPRIKLQRVQTKQTNKHIHAIMQTRRKVLSRFPGLWQEFERQLSVRDQQPPTPLVYRAGAGAAYDQMDLLRFCSKLGVGDNENTQQYGVVDSAFLLRLDCYLKIFIEPLTCMIGILLNTFCLLLFIIANCRRRNYHSVLVPYLSGLCAFDALQNFLTIAVLDVQAWAQYKQDLYPNEHWHWWELKRISAYTVCYGGPVLYTVNFAFIWTITAIAIERHRAVCNPLAAVPRGHDDSATTNRGWLIVLCIACAAATLNFSRWFESKVVIVTINGTNVTNSLHYYDVDSTPLTRNPTYTLMMNMIIYTTFIYCLPLLLLTVLNMRILCTLYSLSPFAFFTSRQSTANRQPTFGVRRRELRSAWMLVTIIILFFVCHTGGLALRFLSADFIHKHQKLFYLLVDLSNFLFNVNTVLNPVIYFLFTRQFRDFWRTSFGPSMSTITKSAHGIAAATMMTHLLRSAPGCNSPAVGLFMSTTRLNSNVTDPLLSSKRKRSSTNIDCRMTFDSTSIYSNTSDSNGLMFERDRLAKTAATDNGGIMYRDHNKPIKSKQPKLSKQIFRPKTINSLREDSV